MTRCWCTAKHRLHIGLHCVSYKTNKEKMAGGQMHVCTWTFGTYKNIKINSLLQLAHMKIAGTDLMLLKLSQHDILSCNLCWIHPYIRSFSQLQNVQSTLCRADCLARWNSYWSREVSITVYNSLSPYIAFKKAI